MNKTKQATLFQSWGSKHATDKRPAETVQSTSTDNAANDDVIDLCDDFDDDEEDNDILLHAEETFATNLHDDTTNDNQGNACDISFGADDYTASQHQSAQDLPGFDPCAGKLWIYPTNYPVRNYQFNIVQQALFKNTMVTLPTGLGKTFIGAVVMYNFYRWYPRGKVVFMAPTKPLVAQQIEACYNIMGIPQQHTAEMTGTMGPQKRKSAWQEKRVFFLTPQVLTNDLSRGSCPGSEVRCLVIDEAHKALGNHAYCQVVRELIKHTQSFRILALSATPGSDIKSVQLVLSNLLISHIEIRTEESVDIKQYCHERKVDKVVVPLGDELTKVKTKYIQVMETVVRRLKQYGVLYNRDTTSFSKFLILKAREGFRQDPPEKLQRSQFGMVEGDFAIAMSLYHGYELLQLHGSRSLYNFLQGILSGDKAHGRTRTELAKNADFNDLIELLSEKYKPSTSGTDESKPMVVGHPKMVKLQEIVLEHFNKFNGAATRVMIFSQYRDSVQEITDMLHVHKPMIKVMSFIGQATAGKNTKGFTQKEQLKVMKQFREGGYNTLVSTCVGEEGLDIGDVDLIICFDAHKSPIRLVQRMGRTGRKREGRIVMLLTEGKEVQIYNQSQYSKRSIHKAIQNGAKSLHFYPHNPRMIPAGFHPAVHKMHITVKETFRPDRKITTEKASDQKPIAHALGEGPSKKGPEEILTLEEYRELEPWLVPEADIPRLVPSSMLSLPPKQEEVTPSGALLSLTEWLPWQTTLQETDKVDHSMSSRHLVELMGFVQLQQSLDPDDDPYGLEMAAYLNEEDVLKPGETDEAKGSLLKWCQSTSAETLNNKGNVKKGGKKKCSSRKAGRCSDALQALEEIDNDCDRSSDDDLPAFDLGKKPQDKTDKNENISAENSDERKHLKRKRRHTSNQSVIEVLQDDNSNDFDDAATKFESCSTKKKKTVEVPPTKFSFETKQDLDTAVTLKSASSSKANKDLRDELYRVPPAPPTDSLNEILSELDNAEHLYVDLVGLAKEWQMENPLGQCSKFPKCDLDTDSDSGSSIEDFPVLYKGSSKLRSDNDSVKSNVSRYSVGLDADVTSDVDMNAGETSPVLENEKYSKVQRPINVDFTSENRLPSIISEDNVTEVHNRLCLSPMSPKSDQASDPSSSPEGSPVFHKSQKRNLLDDRSSKPSKPQSSDTGTSKRDTVSVQSSDIGSSKREAVSAQSSDSWSCDGMDDSLFKDIKTPQVLEAQFAATQVTFTQAFECVHSGSVGSDVDSSDFGKRCLSRDTRGETCKRNTEKGLCENNNEHHELSSSSLEFSIQKATRHRSNGSVCESEGTRESPSVTEEHREETVLNHSKSKSNEDVHPVNKEQSEADQRENVDRQSPSSEEEVEFPDFDLGFDIEDGIIPPSPQSQVAKVTRLSQLFRSDTCEKTLEKSSGKQTLADILEESRNEEERSICDTSVKKKMLFSDKLSETGNCTSNETKKRKGGDNCDTIIENESKEFSKSTEVSHSTKKPNNTATNEDYKGESKDLNRNEENTFEVQENHENSQAESTGYQYDSLNFDTSFALLDDDLDEWINSGKNEICVASEDKVYDKKGMETVEQFGKYDTESKKLENINKIDDTNSSKTPAPKEKNLSLYMKDMSSVFFEDSFNSPGGSPASENAVKSTSSNWLMSKSSSSSPSTPSSEKAVKSTSSNWLTSKSNTSTPGTPLSVNAVKSRNSNWLTSKSNTSTPVFSSHRKSSTPVVGIQRKVQAVTPFRSFCDTTDVQNDSDHEDSFLVRRNKKVNKTVSSESSVHNETELEDSFIGRRSKKANKLPVVFSDSDNDDFAGNILVDKSNESTEKNKKPQNKVEKRRIVELVTSDSENDDDFDDSFLLTKNKYVTLKPDSRQATTISSDEFEDDVSIYNRKELKSKNYEDSYKSTKSVKHKSVKQKRPSNPFIDEEAELSEENSGEASSDEEEGSDLDKYDDSFIQDSQFSQSTTMNQTDMHAVYLNSVKSPVARRGGYKLAYNSKHVNVFSQVPQEEESQYMEDSFCVGSEHESEDEMDWLAMGGEESHGEITMLNTNASILHGPGRPRRRNTKAFMTSRQRDLHTGRMNALDKIRAKALGKKTGQAVKGKENKKEAKGPVQKKNRLQILEESSSEDEGIPIKFSQFASPAVRPVPKANKNKLRIMSSSEEEADEFDTLATKAGSNNSSKEESDLMTRIKPRLKSSENHEVGLSGDSDKNTRSKSGFLISDCKSIAKSEKQSVILVDSKELNGAQCIISDLRFKHNIHVSTAQLGSCDYMVSNRIAVERKQWSEFSNGSNRSKLIDRVQHLQRSYDKVCLIVEKDRVKTGEEPPKVTHWSKYIDRTCAMLLRSQVKIMFSDNQNETAVILSDLCQVEHRKEMGITARVDLSPERSNLIKFYSSIPSVTYINALNLCDGFASVKEFMYSSVQTIQERGKMSKVRAAAVYNYIRRHLDTSALPKSKS